jgi:3beta-hydroxysteroid-4beta-carboxylate 3-dehydrogenase (decarboxylating)
MILVTGGTGHLGANLLRLLLSQGEKVRVLVRKESNLAALDHLDIEKAVGDLRDPASLEVAANGCDRVFHCAALVSTTEGRRGELFETNILGTRNLLRAAKRAGVRRVVVSGSLSAVGHVVSRPCNEDDPFDPFAESLPYAHSKAGMEHECLKAVIDGLDVVIAVSCAIIGPHDYVPSRVGRAFLDYAHGRMRFYVAGGFEFVAAHDVAHGHLLAMERGRPGQKYILSTQFLTLDEILDLWAKVTGSPKRPRRLSAGLVRGCAKVVSALVASRLPNATQRFTPGAIRLLQLRRRADIGKARAELGYQPTSIAAAVEAAYEDFVRRGMIVLRKNRSPDDNSSRLYEEAPR